MDDLDQFWDSDLEHELLLAAFVLWYGTVLKAVHTLTITMLNLGPVPLDDPAVSRMILEARAAAVTVDLQTRKMIAQRLAEGARLGLTPYEIAYGTNDFPGIDGLFKETWKSRPLTVARTELQRAQNRATVDRFRQLGNGRISRVRAEDGDYDAACDQRNGREYPLSSAPDILHPNCTLRLIPIFDP